jgi:serine/threonine protein kinase
MKIQAGVYMKTSWMNAPETEAPSQDKAAQDARWMSPEVLKDAEYTHKSDVWAMGVVMYEITSFARLPYGSMTPREITTELASGYRLEQPPACSAMMYVCADL